jgi:2-methylisocitrate lyase-like PEP mutase family enzyme
VAGVQLEDQVWPKKCGHLGGKKLIEADEMVGKIAAAREADDDIVIVARCDAVAVEGLSAALERGAAYAAAGADVLFIEAPESVADLEVIGRRFDGMPLLFNMAASGRTPFMSAAEIDSLGFKLIILPNYALLAAIKTMQHVLATLRATGDVRLVLDDTIPFSELLRIVGLDRIQEMESRFATPTMTTYEGR